MKNFNFKINTAVLLLIIGSISCSIHCDDEDYTKDSKPKSTIKSDSIKVDSPHHNET